jgi:dTDP-4-dehydrorhamnose reductase
VKILILGHNGLLGNMVYSYFSSLKKYEIITTDFRWDSREFKNFLTKDKYDFIINCIGIIPQRKPTEEKYELINYELPVWLDSLGIKIIHPDTDEPDDTPYGLSKKMSRDRITENTKIIKTSIIGFEKETSFSFLEWFLHSEGKINGYTNQFWNGNTTLEWAKFAEKIIQNWELFNRITILANPECHSKYEILLKFREIFEKDIEIIPIEASIPKNNCLLSDFICDNLVDQIIEMINFYKK